MKQTELVSIILPVHNASAYLASSLESILSQTYSNIEIVAIDDHSSDDSYKILRQFSKKDKRLRVFKNKKRYGLAICFNRALKQTKSTFVAFMDAKDLSARSRIKKQLNFLLTHPKVVAVGVQCHFLKEKNASKSNFPEAHEIICQNLLSGQAMQFETVMVNKKLFPKDVLRFVTHPAPHLYTDAFMKLLEYGTFANLADYLYKHRLVKPTRRSKRRKMKHFTTLLKIFYQYASVHDYRFSPKAVFLPLIKQI